MMLEMASQLELRYKSDQSNVVLNNSLGEQLHELFVEQVPLK
jgi:hypothetical protein